MSNEELLNYGYFISMGIVIGYVIWCILYDYFVNEYPIDVADLLCICVGIIFACIPYVNIVGALCVLIRGIISILEGIVEGVVNIWQWLEGHNINVIMNRVVVSSRKKKRVNQLVD